MNIGVHESFFFNYGFLWPVVGMLGHTVVFILSFVRNLHTLLHSSCISLHSHQQGERVPLSPYSLDIYLLLVDFMMMAILIRGS